MIQGEEKGTRPLPSTWLARARAQSRDLADARMKKARPFRFEDARGRDGALSLALHPIALCLSGALLVLLGTGAWAFVVRARRATEMPPAASTVPASIPASAPSTSAAPVHRPAASIAPSRPPKPATPITRSRARITSPTPPVPPHAPAPSSDPVRFEEGEGDLIFVSPHPKQPPLFTPEEWKRTRALPLE